MIIYIEIKEYIERRGMKMRISIVGGASFAGPGVISGPKGPGVISFGPGVIS